jgi:hypothetical protein
MVAFVPQLSGTQGYAFPPGVITAVPRVRENFGTRNEISFSTDTGGRGADPFKGRFDGFKQRPYVMASGIGQNTPGGQPPSDLLSGLDTNRTGANAFDNAFNRALVDAVYSGDFQLNNALPPVDQANPGDVAAKALDINASDTAANGLGALSVAAPDVQKSDQSDFRPNDVLQNAPIPSFKLEDIGGELKLVRVYTA